MSDFSCAICLETASGSPVVTVCGHLFCWACLEKWLDRIAECPVCRRPIDRTQAGDIIQLYGKGSGGRGPIPTSAPPQPPPRPPAQPRQDADGNDRFHFRVGGMPFGAFIFLSPSIIPLSSTLLMFVLLIAGLGIWWYQQRGQENRLNVSAIVGVLFFLTVVYPYFANHS